MKPLFLLLSDFLNDFLSLRTDVNVPTESNKQKKLEKNLFLLASWKSPTKRAGSGSRTVNQVYGSKDPDQDPYQNVTDPEYCQKDFQNL